MRLSETQLRRMIRQELLKEMDVMGGMGPQEPQEEPEGIHAGAIAGGVGVAGALAGINALLMHIQTSGVGADIAEKIRELSQMIQGAMEE